MKRLVLIATAVAVLAGAFCFFWPSKPLCKKTAPLRIETTTPYVFYPTQGDSRDSQRFVETVLGPLTFDVGGVQASQER